MLQILMAKMQFVGYALMIVAYVLHLYERSGFASVTLIVAIVLVIAAFVGKSGRKSKPSQSVGDRSQAKGNIRFENVKQSAGNRDRAQSVGDKSRAEGNITFKDIEQKINGEDRSKDE
jgi:hypothetical protein